MIEIKTKDTVLQRGTDVEIGGMTYHAASPTLATLIEISALIAELPKVEMDANNVASECLANARHFGSLGDIVALLILGAKKRYNIIYRIRRHRLAERIIHNVSPSQMNKMCADLLKELDLADFFAVTTFLTNINLTKETKAETGKVERKKKRTTASGQ